MLFGLTLGIFEMVFLAAFIPLLLIGITLDRRGREGIKWYVFGLGFVICATWFWKDWTFSGIFGDLQSWSFWEPILYYLGAGLVYAILEFILDVRRSARSFKALWESALTQTVRIKQEDLRLDMSLQEALKVTDNGAVSSAVEDQVSRFIDRNYSTSRIVILTKGEDGMPSPKINKIELSEHIGAWTFFWPFYMLSLILGDLLTEIFIQLSEFLVSISGRFVRMSFKDVFKF